MIQQDQQRTSTTPTDTGIFLSVWLLSGLLLPGAATPSGRDDATMALLNGDSFTAARSRVHHDGQC
jgi:hypothetical protein